MRKLNKKTTPSSQSRSARKSSSRCATPLSSSNLDSYAAIVRDYRKNYRVSADEVFTFYAQLPTVQDAVKKASYAELPNGHRHPHQYRIKRANLKKAHDILKCRNLGACETFHELFELVEEAIGAISGIGELMVYDTAHRLGAFLGLQPEHVYLHAGVRVGAAALGIDRSQKWIDPKQLPRPFWPLSPQQLEDCLCIYKEELGAIGEQLGEPA